MNFNNIILGLLGFVLLCVFFIFVSGGFATDVGYFIETKTPYQAGIN